ncbi:amino acid ABC transporter permease [Oceanibacterium hippocampi]|uniref:Inner membrane amino-acid ABC transporter permease protein YecS n=1 Tax=Oceanibacterium hippocampi TaxID=745714 RepID=A0A1Y5TIL1_9PROT|nr:amino acid ABC transporter permease [Oceanibacterium hippocampi]SLN64966.1 Inner membrane amino-acid ABC transporter permease protein YecS [Oceanibacterium hippocampi]
MSYNFNFTPIWNNFDLLLQGALVTLQLSATTMVFGLLVGLVGASLKLWGPRPGRWIATGYVDFIRNTPLLAQLFIVYFGLPSLGVRISAETAAVIGLTIYMGAYATEIVRAGITAIPKSQIEAGRCLGMSHWQVFRYVIVFPALKTVYPALTSQFVLLMLGSSLVSLISAKELFHVAAYLDSRTFLPFEIYLVVSLMYLAMSLGFRVLFRVVGHFAFAKT